MNNLRLCCLFLLGSVLCPAMISSQAQPPSSPAATAAPKTPAEFFARARQLSDLEAAGIPFHLKATYVASGNAEFTGNGTYEEWWESKDTWRKEATLGDYRYVGIRNAGVSHFYSTSNYVPLRLRQAMQAVLIRIPADVGISGRWKMHDKNLSGMNLVSISKKYPCMTTMTKPSGTKCLQQDYFTADGVLRMQVLNGTATVANGMRRFGNLLIPRNISMADIHHTQILAIVIKELQPLGTYENPASTIIATPVGLPQAEEQISADEIPADQKLTPSHIVRPIAPEYPAAARQQEMEGTVVIFATIDGKGDVREPYLIQSCGALLDSASLQAVRRWKFPPIAIGGKPTTVETTVSFIYRLRRD